MLEDRTAQMEKTLEKLTIISEKWRNQAGKAFPVCEQCGELGHAMTN